MLYIRTSPPAEAPLEIDLVCKHLKIEAADLDAEQVLLEAYLAAVVDHLDGRTGILGRCLVTQEWQAHAHAPERLPDFHHARGFRLELGPVQSDAAIAVEYRSGNTWQAVDPDAVMVVPASGGRAFVVPAPGSSWPHSQGGWRVTFTAGSEPDDTPPAIKAAILLLVEDLYGNRGGKSVANLIDNPTIGRLLGPYTMVSV